MEISRSDQRSATVGDDFEVTGVYPLAQIGKGLDKKDPKAVVAVPDMYEELTYYSASELCEKFHFDEPEGPGMDSQDDGPSFPDPDGDDDLPFGDASDDGGGDEGDEGDEGKEDTDDSSGDDDLPWNN